MERELLLEIGCEELPASWLPDLTTELGEALVARLREHRLSPDAPAETYSTPRRLTTRIAHVTERQTDLEELINGPAVAGAFKADGTPTPAAVGFATKHGVDVSALERVTTAKGTYVAFRKRQRGRAAVDVLPDVLSAVLRALTFPKTMHWDAMLEDGRGELLFGRPIRWLLFLYGGRVVPFSISRTPGAQSGQVQDVATGAFTYGHRFLTTSGRAGRSIKVKSFDDYRARLLENFVILARSERHDKIVRELDAKAQRLNGRVSRRAHARSELLSEVPDLVEYPSVVAGTFASEFAQHLPEEVLITTLVHHQHYFPVEDKDGRLLPAFLAVINSEPDNERTISRNAERVVSARLRDARFFWESDRRTKLEARIDRLETLLFHRKLGNYKEKAERIERLARRIAKEALGAKTAQVDDAGLAARLAKTDLTTDMVREFTELQGLMGGIYARVEGLPETVSRAIYHHYLPVGIEPDAPPSKADLGEAETTWAAVALADKLDTIVGLFAAGEKPTGSRDPFGLRRAAQGVTKLLVDGSDLLRGETHPVGLLEEMIDWAFENYGGALQIADTSWKPRLFEFMVERQAHLFERRGFTASEFRAVSRFWKRPADVLARLEALRKERGSADFAALAEVAKRVGNITKGHSATVHLSDLAPLLREPAEIALATELGPRSEKVRAVVGASRFTDAIREIVQLRGPLDRFFTDVLVMSDDQQMRTARLSLLALVRDTINLLADISEIVPAEQSAIAGRLPNHQITKSPNH
jgi:glycyl-tRNA synthetase beta chain